MEFLIYDYFFWLAVFALVFVVVERVRPTVRRSIVRAGFLTDVGHFLFNAKVFGMLTAAVIPFLIESFENWLDRFGLYGWIYRGVVEDWPLWAQFLGVLFGLDLCKYLIHNLLHRVSWLWEFHKVHHSITEMDWIGNWRFHWLEAVIYDTLLYVPVVYLGCSGYVLFWYAVIGTLVGQYAHANLQLPIGPFKYLINHPELHIWHHAHPDSGPLNRNFGIVFCCWDWIFGTAYLPDQKVPARLGFEGIETFPKTFWFQQVWPLRKG